MPAPKFNLVINRILLGIILLGGLALVGIVGVLGIVSWHFIHTAYIERSWVNPIKDETFQVDLDLVAEGQSYHITRAYKCDDVSTYRTGQFSRIIRDVFPSQRIITQRLPSKHAVYIAVPNGCSFLLREIVEHRPCAQLAISPSTADCGGSFPVIRDHIPFVLWTRDLKRPTEMIGYINKSSFESRGASVTRANATITLRSGLNVSPPDENNWLRYPFPTRPDSPPTRASYFTLAYVTDLTCGESFLHGRILHLRDGGNVARYKDSCLVPVSRDGKLMNALTGFVVFHEFTGSVKRPKNITQRDTYIGAEIVTDRYNGHD